MSILHRRIAAVSLSFALPAFGASAAIAGTGADVVDDALEAMGGRSALESVTVVIREGEGTRQELGQMREPGGEQNTAQTRDVTEIVDLENSRVALDYTVINEGFEQERLEVLTTYQGEPIGWGTTSGRDNIAVSPDSLFSWAQQNHPQMWLRREPIRILLEAAEGASSDAAEDAELDGRASLRTHAELADGESVELYVDADTGLLNGFVVTDTEPMLGDVEARYILDDYAPVAGADAELLLPHTLQVDKGGSHFASMDYASIRVNDDAVLDIFELPEDVHGQADQVLAADGPWAPMEWVEVAPGVYHAVAFSHNSMVVEFDDYVAVAEAPYNEAQSLVLARMIEERIGKPIEYVAPTHPHYDHTGGLRGMMALGATALLSAPHAIDLRPIIDAPHSNPPDKLAQRREAGEPVGGVQTFGESLVIEDGGQSLGLHAVGGFPHMDPMVLVHVPEQGVLFQSDLFFGGPSPDAERLYEAVEALGLDVETIVGGHSGAMPYSVLEEAVAAAE